MHIMKLTHNIMKFPRETTFVTQCVLNRSHDTNIHPILSVQIGLVDLEINRLTKILFLAVILLSLVMLSLKGFSGFWFIFLIRYVILFSFIIPIR